MTRKWQTSREGSRTYEQLVYGEYNAKLEELELKIQTILKQREKANDAEHATLKDEVAELKKANDAEHATLKDDVAELKKANDAEHEQIQGKVDALKVADGARQRTGRAAAGPYDKVARRLTEWESAQKEKLDGQAAKLFEEYEAFKNAQERREEKEALAEKADELAFRNELRAELDAKLAEEKAEDLKEREAMEAKFEQKLAALRGELEGRLEAPDELVALVKNALEEDLNDRDYHAYEEFTAGDEKVKAQLSGKIKEVREEAKAAAAANAAAARAAAEAAAEASTLAQLAGGVDDDDPERSTSFEPGPARQQSADL